MHDIEVMGEAQRLQGSEQHPDGLFEIESLIQSFFQGFALEVLHHHQGTLGIVHGQDSWVFQSGRHDSLAGGVPPFVTVESLHKDWPLEVLLVGEVEAGALLLVHGFHEAKAHGLKLFLGGTLFPLFQRSIETILLELSWVVGVFQGLSCPCHPLGVQAFIHR